MLGIRKVNIGQYLNSGDPIVALQSMDPIYVNFTLPQQNLKDFGVGSTVEVRTDATGDQLFPGKITAINSMVDEATRNFQAQATLANHDLKLRPGMFANVDVLEAGDGAVLPVPSSAINYAPYGNSVFVLVKNMQPAKDDPLHPKGDPYLGVEQHFVTTGQTKGDLVAVLKGLKEGDEIVSSGVFKVQNKGAVLVTTKQHRQTRSGSRAAPGRELERGLIMSAHEIIAEINKLTSAEREEIMTSLGNIRKTATSSLAELAKAEGHKEEDVWDVLERFAGTFDGLPEDMAVNHDHHLYGTPKQKP